MEKNIKKVIFNGNENWQFVATYTNTSSFKLMNFTDIKRNNTELLVMSNYFQGQTTNNRTLDVIGVAPYSTEIYIRTDRSIATVDAFKTWLGTNNTTLYYVLATPTTEEITDTYLLEQLNNLLDIELYEELCYVDWVGIEKPTMTLKYNYDTKYKYDLGVQDFTLENGKEYTIETNGLNLILLNNDTVVYNNTGGSFTPTSDLEITHAYLVINREQYYNVRIDLKVIQEFNLVTTDFDIHYAQDGNIVTNQEYSSNGIIARYQYTFNRDTEFRLYADGSLVSLGRLTGRKITAIGFSNNWIGGGQFQSTRPVLAVLDTSNYDLRFNSAETLDITRVDSFSSDSQFFVKTNEVRGPIHLAPMGMPELKWSKTENDLLWFYKQGIARLEEVYLTNYPTNEGTKVLTMFDVYGEKTDDFQTDNNKINFKKIEVATGGKELRPNIALSPSNKVSPVTSGYKYVLYKYRIYQPLVKMQTGYEETDFFDTDLVYYMAQEIPHSGDLNLQIKYERS